LVNRTDLPPAAAKAILGILSVDEQDSEEDSE